MIFSEKQFMEICLDAGRIQETTKVLVFVLKFAPKENPVLVATAKKIANYLGCSVSVVSKALKRFENMGLISRVQNGVWHVNYEVIEKTTEHNKITAAH